MHGKIHSFESFGTVDGPGIRFVVFMQGCPLRCLYCHNPDTWSVQQTGNYNMNPDQLMDEVLKYKSFIASGGVTVSGGEPLMQSLFVCQFLKLCKQNGIHTAIDTSGAICTDDAFAVLDYTDLVLLDVKSIDAEQHVKLTGAPMNNTLKFLDRLEADNVDTWIRHVIVPGWTDSDELLQKLAEYLAKYKVVRKVELLPYHLMGSHKYEQLGVDYRLKGIEALSAERLENARRIFQSAGLNM